MCQNLSPIGILVYKLQLFLWSYGCKFSKQCKNLNFMFIKHCFLRGKNTVQAKQFLNKCYLDSVLWETMVKRWYADFKSGCTDTNVAECSGYPNSAVVQENTKNSTNSLWPIMNWSCMRYLRIWRYQKAVYSPFFMNICQWKSCVQSGWCICSQSIKKNNALMIQSIVYNATKQSFA